MNCADYRDAIVDFARQTPDAGDERRVRAHVAECSTCAAQLARQQALSVALRGLAEEAAAERGSDALEERLVAIFVAEQTTATLSMNTPARRWWWVAVAAGLILVGTSIAWWRGTETALPRQGQSPVPPASVEASSASPAPVIATAPAAVALVLDRGRAVGLHRPPVHREPRVLRPAGFVTIPSATGLPDFESGEIVRTHIPVSSLPVYGVEIPPDAVGTPVEADLLVGQDGQARAIRLVTTDSRDSRSRR